MMRAFNRCGYQTFQKVLLVARLDRILPKAKAAAKVKLINRDLFMDIHEIPALASRE